MPLSGLAFCFDHKPKNSKITQGQIPSALTLLIGGSMLRVSLEHGSPGVARQLVTFSCVAKKR